MTQPIEEITSKVQREVEWVQDGKNFFLVLNQKATKDFVFNIENIKMIMKALDDILEASAGKECVMYTCSTQKKKFSTGFDTMSWLKETGYAFRSNAIMQKLLVKLITFPMPTACIIEGHCYAGGVMFALSHDYKIIKAGSGKICLSEINIGQTLPPAYAALVQHIMPRQLLREMAMGRPIKTAEALERKLVNMVYLDQVQLARILNAFTKQFAPKGKKRGVVREMKEVLHRDIIFKLESVVTSPHDQLAIVDLYRQMEDSQKEAKL